MNETTSLEQHKQCLLAAGLAAGEIEDGLGSFQRQRFSESGDPKHLDADAQAVGSLSSRP